MTAATAAYDALLAHTRETALLGSTSALLAWDQETYMPRGAGEVRAQQLALLAKLQHERTTDPRVAEWLHTCENDPQLAADGDRAANVRGLRRDYDRATRLPATLVTALAELESRAQQEWADARSKSNFRRFQPWLERMVALQQQKADCLTRPGQSRWDALADLYEPGMNAASLRELFAPLRQRLVALRQKLARGKAPAETFGRAVVDEARQQAFGRAVLTAMGFDLQRGRIDQSAHPFCTSTGGDVRLTTRYHRDRVLDALGSTMHEGGHGLYEQGLDPRHLGTPLGEAVSLGIHESQSRLWENHVGRSAAFWHWCWPLAGVVLDQVPELRHVFLGEGRQLLEVLARIDDDARCLRRDQIAQQALAQGQVLVEQRRRAGGRGVCMAGGRRSRCEWKSGGEVSAKSAVQRFYGPTVKCPIRLHLYSLKRSGVIYVRLTSHFSLLTSLFISQSNCSSFPTTKTSVPKI